MKAIRITDIDEFCVEFLCAQGEVAHGDCCDELDGLSDAQLADRLVTQWRDRLDEVDFGALVAAFGRVRAEVAPATRRDLAMLAEG